jgi:hypothetical protein
MHMRPTRPATVVAEALESRTLFSASAASVVLSAAVKADQLQVKADLLTFRSDAAGNTLTLLTDAAAIKADGVKGDPALKPLLAKFHKDIHTMSQQLRLDRLAEARNALADESAIVSDRRRILLDKGDATALAADKAKLLSDRVKLQQDLLAGLDSRIATRQDAYATIFADGQAIVDAAKADPNASAALVKDLDKLTADKTVCMNTVTADLQKLVADRQQLVSDLTAMQSMS